MVSEPEVNKMGFGARHGHGWSGEKGRYRVGWLRPEGDRGALEPLCLPAAASEPGISQGWDGVWNGELWVWT